MCTAIRFNERYFGRTFDYERGFGERLIVTPRERTRILGADNRYAMMGVGVIFEGTPLYFDGVNEWGLIVAALNFPSFAVYRDATDGEMGIAAGQLCSHILGVCRSVDEAIAMLKKITVTPSSPDGKISSTPLHWIISDQRESAVVESVADGLKITKTDEGVLTNSPPIEYHGCRLCDFSSLSPTNPKASGVGIGAYSRGMGAIGLPGDFSSSSRFVRAAILKKWVFERDNADCVCDIERSFSVLSSVTIPVGAVISDEGLPVYTRYTAVIDMESPAYYLTTATCRTVSRISLTDKLFDDKEIRSYPIYFDNEFPSLIEN